MTIPCNVISWILQYERFIGDTLHFERNQSQPHLLYVRIYIYIYGRKVDNDYGCPHRSTLALVGAWTHHPTSPDIVLLEVNYDVRQD